MSEYVEITKRQSIINNTETDYWNDFEANRVIPTLIDIIEKQREMIAEDEDYLGHKKYCQMGEIIDLGNDVTDTMDCTCGYNEFLRKRTCETIKLTEE